MEDIKKAFSYTAYGFLFTLVNLNLVFGERRLNCMPDFIGWILLLLAIRYLSAYTENKQYIRYMAIIMIPLTAAQEVLTFVYPETNFWLLSTVVELMSVLFIFTYFDCLRLAAEDAGSQYSDQIFILRWLHVAVYMIGAIISVLARNTAALTRVALFLSGYALFALIVAVWTFVILWKMKKEVSAM